MQEFKKCTIIGTHHELEYKDRDEKREGEKQILNFLEQVIPDTIVIELGYWWNRLNDFSGRPADEEHGKYVKDNHWASIWGKKEKINVILADLDEKLDTGTDEKLYILKREEAISKKILETLQKDYKNIILFCGKDHVDPIKNIIEKEVSVDVGKIN